MRALASLLVLTCCTYTHADSLPSFLNTNETTRTLPAPNLPADAYRPPAAPLNVPEPSATAGQPLMMGTQVTIGKLQIEGGTIYPLSELAVAYQPLLGHQTTLAQWIEATRDITRRYQADGYLLSYAFLPQQSFDQGVMRVVLVEGYIKDYQVQGDVGRSKALLDKLVAKLSAERPLTRKTFERYTTLMSRIPGITLQAQVPPPGTTDGASYLMAQASRKPFGSTLSMLEDNRKGTQALLGVSSQSQTSMGEKLTLTGLFPPGDDHEKYYQLDYSQFLNAEGTQLVASGSRYRADPAAVLVTDNGYELKSHRETDRYSLGFTHALVASPTEQFNAGAKVYTVDDKTHYTVRGSNLTADDKTNIRALAVEGDWRKADERQLRIISAGMYQGINDFGARTNNPAYDLDFFRARFSGVQSNKFFDNWQGVLSAALYWSDDTLPDSERAVFGGQNFGRGYPDDQASGDKGWGAAYEVNYSFNRDGTWVRVLQPYVVLDRAKTWFNTLPVKGSDLSSAAVGLRFGDAKYYNIALEAAKAMSDEALDTFNRRTRYSLSFSYQL
ncbi:Hemolysin activation/secretion protein [Pseudomonas sp. ok272]|uniref:ShlB/FhaC/HecB family hemolysin secretion/activation protein n=1 Tax=unclassified Pseudomonas TaxID=196821 RepID=UPI0008AF4B04|nr:MULTISPECIES: POTRA domain-containing protein [unclassified Pseudomonas]SEN61981.1 Hemolysin activation/secretion protein [Pseudomonas sp. ok272]SFN39924.1 Hemolysin activation/secretion protein [Pseudomonas sp. ok602]